MDGWMDEQCSLCECARDCELFQRDLLTVRPVSLLPDLSALWTEKRHKSFIKEFQEYVEPEEGYQGSPQRRGPSSGQEDEHVSLPLGENVLTHNLGIPVLVVCTKCDAVSVLEKEHDYREEHFDFIQSHIRRFCLQYGAALIYTSVKEEKNLDLLYKYIVHKTYGFQFTTPALVVEKDAVFIPAGWDNEKKIAILHENFTTVKPEDAYEDFIVKPPVRKLVHDKELAAEDEQVFLMKQQSFLAKQPATPTRASESPARGPAGSPRTQGRAGPANVPSASPITSVKKPDPNIKNNAASEGVLASFFNSLLSKKTGSPGSPGAGGVQSTAKKSGQKTVLTNVQEELDRMTRKPDSMVSRCSCVSCCEEHREAKRRILIQILLLTAHKARKRTEILFQSYWNWLLVCLQTRCILGEVGVVVV
ncbi:cytoplasmic dynein 1 light intermediate chain 2 isoform 7-T7 [Alca torda]